MKEDRCGDAIFVNAKRGAEKKVGKEKPNIVIWAKSNACPRRYLFSALASQRLIGSCRFVGAFECCTVIADVNGSNDIRTILEFSG